MSTRKTRSIVCIACPVGCRLEVDWDADALESAVQASGLHSAGGAGTAAAPDAAAEKNAAEETGIDPADPGAAIRVTGNRCPRGEVYAREEILAPVRTLTTTCRIVGNPQLRRVPVRSAAPIPAEKIPEILAVLHRLELRSPIAAGTEVWKDGGIVIVTTGSG